MYKKINNIVIFFMEYSFTFVQSNEEELYILVF